MSKRARYILVAAGLALLVAGYLTFDQLAVLLQAASTFLS